MTYEPMTEREIAEMNRLGDLENGPLLDLAHKLGYTNLREYLADKVKSDRFVNPVIEKAISRILG
jgi:hypothetical protein